MVQGKKRDPVDVKYDGLIAETRRTFKTIIRTAKLNAKTNSEKKMEQIVKLMGEVRKEEIAIFDEAVERMAMTVNGVYEQARQYEKMTNPFIKGLEEQADYWDDRVGKLDMQLKRIYSENRELRAQRDELKLFYDAKMKYDTGEDAPPGYFDED